ncbi:hypothetical protein SAMN06295912_11462 [Sphingomonas laterariae]|uniref:5-bromo-4-chloroindolyl phosphate hydrolysis protein n=1 Tax=Edaphosphingomonas laterariae TaxID=861865 RepID=A0A239GZB5_9SPHN|nr:hypothetical protein [Sphingomonas laterariae]SNS74559.1 hypothetical protein SAMN06295912_11462 [Sphingomonas laterariae]
MVDSSRVLEQAEAMLRRVSPEAQRMRVRARKRRRAAFFRRFKLAVMAALAVLIGAGILVALNISFPVFLAGLVAIFVALGILFWPSAPEPTADTLVQSEIKALPQQTEQWLERQRPALPAPAQRLADGIGVRLEALAPQLATLDPATPAAYEIRKLIGEELPELVSGYQRVPASLRREERNGKSPDRQLVEGLEVVESELARMTEQLASGDLHRLATQGRFLELKYRGEGEG